MFMVQRPKSLVALSTGYCPHLNSQGHINNTLETKEEGYGVQKSVNEGALWKTGEQAEYKNTKSPRHSSLYY